MLTANGFEKAFIGVGTQFNKEVAVYDKNKCIDILAEDMSIDEAHDFFEYNVVGAYVGECTPVFVEVKSDE